MSVSKNEAPPHPNLLPRGEKEIFRCKEAWLDFPRVLLMPAGTEDVADAFSRLFYR
jgi:hypothetical protein